MIQFLNKSKTLKPIDSMIDSYIKDGKVLHLDALYNAKDGHKTTLSNWYDWAKENIVELSNTSKSWNSDYISCENDIIFTIKDFDGLSGASAYTLHMRFKNLSFDYGDTLFLSGNGFDGKGYWQGGTVLGAIGSGMVIGGTNGMKTNLDVSSIFNVSNDLVVDIIVIPSGNAYVYINGTLTYTFSGIVSGAIQSAIEDFHIGQRGNYNVPYLYCNLKEYILYNRALTAEEIAENTTISNARYDKSQNITYGNSSELLKNRVLYDLQGNMLMGSMANNGSLEYIPSEEEQIIPEGYTSGGVVQGDSNLLPENIKAGITIFGVTGTYTGETATIPEEEG